MLSAQPHYLFITRLLIDLYHAGELPNVAQLEIEPVYGYVGRIVYHDGSVRLFRGTHVGVNDNGASEISRDKGYTKYFLQQLGYQTAPWRIFLLPRYHQQVQRNLSRFGVTEYPVISDIEAYIASIGGYPCYIKPNDESQGKGVYKCYDADGLQIALTEYQRERYNTIIVEQNVPYPDYRVVMYAGEVIACYLRRPLTVIGDGEASIATLLNRKQSLFEAAGRPVLLNLDDPRITKKLAHAGYTLASIPAPEVAIAVYDAANLSTGGDAQDVTEQLHPQWAARCAALTAQMGLKLCGVDLACADIANPDAPYSIIETNAAPGLDNYATLGAPQLARVRALYQRIFNQPHSLF
ncbi:MAG: hypothetical protein H7Y11_00075 [Armatimonadetes bacterium]|nr:hypothetical protein [Anaerolineae bacterium]